MAKTVFIIGAGASYKYGFPLGGELVSQIINQLTPSHYNLDMPVFTAEKKLANILRQSYNSEYLIEFRNSLELSETNSIDAFLSQPENTKYHLIGKMCISNLLLKSEYLALRANKLRGNWYKLLWNKINSENPSNFDFSIYTFNYDRSLDFYLERVTENFFGYKEKRSELKSFISNIPITHLHGSLGDLENLPFGCIEEIESGGFEKLRSVSQNIDIIFEAKKDEQFVQLHNEIKIAEFLVFLGFGFHPTNIDRIFEIEEFRLKGFPRNIIASTFGMTQLESKTIFENKVLKKLYHLYRSSSGGLDTEESFRRLFSFESMGSEVELFLREKFNFENLFK